MLSLKSTKKIYHYSIYNMVSTYFSWFINMRILLFSMVRMASISFLYWRFSFIHFFANVSNVRNNEFIILCTKKFITFAYYYYSFFSNYAMILNSSFNCTHTCLEWIKSWIIILSLFYTIIQFPYSIIYFISIYCIYCNICNIFCKMIYLCYYSPKYAISNTNLTKRKVTINAIV